MQITSNNTKWKPGAKTHPDNEHFSRTSIKLGTSRCRGSLISVLWFKFCSSFQKFNLALQNHLYMQQSGEILTFPIKINANIKVLCSYLHSLTTKGTKKGFTNVWKSA